MAQVIPDYLQKTHDGDDALVWLLAKHVAGQTFVLGVQNDGRLATLESVEDPAQRVHIILRVNDKTAELTLECSLDGPCPLLVGELNVPAKGAGHSLFETLSLDRFQNGGNVVTKGPIKKKFFLVTSIYSLSHY